MYYVYIIQNPVGKLYTGQTNDLAIRLQKHNNNQNHYTRNKGPWKLLYSEQYNSRSEAMKREKELKTGKGRDWIKKNILP
ncbi:GIY-YIG nuclease family protein [Candidatus Falkowbacteria bacterium]|nr:GIY-YIG nuclease family protein [Candidatus Falkowbacteria bacterium]